MPDMPHSTNEPTDLPVDADSDATRRGTRRDGEASRDRILQVALRLFAAQGFNRTTTREIAAAAHVNVAALNYYFGDKAGLYRAAFHASGGLKHHVQHDTQGFSRPGVPLAQAMHDLFNELLQPLALGERIQWGVRLRMREFVEPTGVWQEEIDHGIKPMHAALTRVICRELDRLRPDADVERLAFAIVGMGVHFIIGRDIINQMAPAVLHDAQAIDILASRIATYACDLVHAEIQRRGEAD